MTLQQGMALYTVPSRLVLGDAPSSCRPAFISPLDIQHSFLPLEECSKTAVLQGQMSRTHLHLLSLHAATCLSPGCVFTEAVPSAPYEQEWRVQVEQGLVPQLLLTSRWMEGIRKEDTAQAQGRQVMGDLTRHPGTLHQHRS